jgi:ubiquinone/menaquinone biosynthesis C-methylase UbiE
MKKLKKYNVFIQESASSEMWNDFINKINTGVIPKDPHEIDIDKLIQLKPSGNVLDISVGDGVNSEYFVENGYRVYGTDISDVAIDTIAEKHPEHNWIVHNTENKFPYQDNMFDIVFAKLSLHYFSKEKLYDIMNDINRILKTDGIFYIMIKISNSGNINTNKKSYTKEEWENFITEFNIIDEKIESRKAYTFEKSDSNLLTIIARKL